ncbi:hypothetical protein IC614_11265 [Allosphingosinicella flava]|uniref:Uncharacterized protein n=1 Tax=Allosphingosinicella flava TaxID=2771430 RepID=A0A7T2LLU7_9SPHN|nr:hypothetical protein [Sphingosinicella flava]QPQ54881.1 hypothetical protein IC614_11265 [Sphingosinicella flava]
MGTTAVLAACVPQRQQIPAPPPVRPQAPPPAPVPPPPPAAPPKNWADLPLTPGNWYYRDEAQTSQALFGPPASEALFLVRCTKASGQVTLQRAGTTTGNTMTVRTSFTARNLPISIQTDPLPYLTATLPATDPLLDSIAFSRGRFTVEVTGEPMLVIPAWPEPARVVEDCRR